MAACTVTLLALPLLLPANAAVALFAAAAWGGGDFAGGMGVKAARGTTAGALRFVVLAHSLSLAVLLVVLMATHASWPTGSPTWWALGGGVAAGVSITAFYMALALGAMGTSAALSGLIAAALPALVSSFVEGAPTGLELAGFAVAAVAIWIIAAPSTSGSETGGAEMSGAAKGGGTTALALVGGFGFGIYFVSLRFANRLGVFEPIALARIGSIVTCSLLLSVLRGKRGTSNGKKLDLTSRLFGWAVGVAVLDTAGNLLFTWSTRLGRLDVAAVLASLYPASTILLAAWRLRERPTRRQWLGMGLALAAVVMITA